MNKEILRNKIRDTRNTAHMTFLEKSSALPYNTLTSYTPVELSDCTLYIPCRSRDEVIMKQTQQIFTHLATLARY